jgi:hypothetical protein
MKYGITMARNGQSWLIMVWELMKINPMIVTPHKLGFNP